MFLNGDITKIYSTATFEKIYIKFAQKFKTVFQTCSGIKFIKILKHLQNFQIISESVEHLKYLRNVTVFWKKLLKFEIYLKIKNFKKILKNIKKISKQFNGFYHSLWKFWTV